MTPSMLAESSMVRPDDKSTHRGEREGYAVLIVGAGLTGLALACALGDALGEATPIALLDPETGVRTGPDMRALALSAGSVHLLEALGAWTIIAPHAQAVRQIDITDSRLEDVLRPVLLSYDNTVAGGEPAAWIVEANILKAALLAGVARRPSIRLLRGQASEGFQRTAHSVTLVLKQGTTLSGAILVAADGRRSPLREAAGIGIVRWPYRQLGIVATLRHEHPHAGRAVQNFLPAGPFAILPLTGNRSSITWTEEESTARAILALDDHGFLVEVEKRFDYRLGPIALSGPRGAWPLDMHLARALVRQRFVLIGDAAHGVHPIAGQGVNLGLRDVAALTEVLADAARLGLDIGALSVLERYERWRRLDGALAAGAFDALNRLFSNDSTLLRTVRGLGLGVLETMPALKGWLVAEAAGLSGSVPKLLRGERV